MRPTFTTTPSGSLHDGGRHELVISLLSSGGILQSFGKLTTRHGKGVVIKQGGINPFPLTLLFELTAPQACDKTFERDAVAGDSMFQFDDLRPKFHRQSGPCQDGFDQMCLINDL